MLLAASACTAPTTTTAQPGDGPADPATSAAAAPTPTPTIDCETASQAEWAEHCQDEAIDTEGDGAGTEDGDGPQTVAKFGEKFVHGDGLEVEVTKIRLGAVTAKDVEGYDDVEPVGTTYAQLTIRVRNGTTGVIDALASPSVTYGPDGQAADTTYLLDVDDAEDISGKILPGKAKSATWTFLVPKKYQDDVVLEFTADYEHEVAIFAGSLKS